MKTMEDIIHITGNLLSIYISIRFMNIFLEKGKRNNKVCFGTGFAYWLENSFCYFFLQNTMWNLISNILGMVVVAVFSYKEKIWKKILAVFSVIVIRMLIEDAVWLIAFGKLADLTVYFLALAIVYIIEIIAEKFLVLREEMPIPRSYYWGMLVMPACSIVLICLLIEGENHSFGDESIMLGLVAVMVMNFLTFFFYDKIFASFNEKWEKHALEEKVAMYENQLELIRQSREEVRALRHDMKNHLHLLEKFVKEEKREELLAYVADMDQAMKVEKEIVKTGNEPIDAILNYMLSRAEKNGTKLSVKVSVPETSFCSSFDLNILLSNLLENAVEALEVCEEKKLKFTMELERGVLYLTIVNSFSGEVKKKGNWYLTRKKNVDEHGIGLQNAMKVVEKYGGTLQMSQEGKLFCVSAILFLGQEDHV